MLAWLIPKRTASTFAAAWFVVVCSAIGSDAAHAQALPQHIEPAQFDFGEVQQGAIVESQALAFLGPGTVGDERPTMTAPPFVKVLAAQAKTWRAAGTRKPRVGVTVEFSVATDVLGRHQGKLEGVFGNEKFDIPIRIEVVERNPKSPSVLILDDPFRSDGMPAGIFAWRELVKRNALDVDYVYRLSGDFLRGVDLSKYGVVLLGDTAIVMMFEQETQSLREFTQRGGRLIVFSWAARTQSPMHRFLKEMGLESQKERIRLDEGEVFSVPFEELPDDPMFRDVTSLRFERGFPIRIVASERALALISFPHRPEEAVLAKSRFGEGDAIAFGQDRWLVWFGEGAQQRFVGADNAKLLENLITLRDRPKKDAEAAP